MTEEDAKTKWCPFARFVSAAIGEHDCFPNRPVEAGVTDPTMCLGTACMAWRRQTVMIDRATNEPAIPGVAAIGQLEERYSTHGFCGLAGAPQ